MYCPLIMRHEFHHSIQASNGEKLDRRVGLAAKIRPRVEIVSVRRCDARVAMVRLAGDVGLMMKQEETGLAAALACGQQVSSGAAA